MLGSGLEGLQEQAMSNMGSMQTSAMSGINQLKLAKYNKANPAETQLPNAYREYQLAQKQGYDGSFMDYKAANKSSNDVTVDFDQGGMKGALTPEQKSTLGLDAESAYVWDKQGVPRAIKPTSYSDTQLKSGTFAERMVNSRDTVADLIDADFDPTSLTQYIGDTVGMLGNYALSDQQQMYIQASHDWIRAKLRKESGAVIAKEEMAKEYATYFPMPGDSDGVRKQKQAARRIAERGMGRESGGAYEWAERETPVKAGSRRPISEMTDDEKRAEIAELKAAQAGGKK